MEEEIKEKEFSMDSLTPKQSRFAQLLAENIGKENPMTKQEMALKAGFSPSMARTHVEKIFKSKGIQAFYKTIGIDKNSKLLRLSEIMYDEDKRASISAIQEINKMVGDYTPTEINVGLKAKKSRDDIFE